MTEYRPVPDEYRATYHRFLDYAFSPEAGPQAYESDDDVRARLADRRGLFDGDDLQAVCGHHWFTARIRGDWHEMAGLSAVASPPENRRQGLVTRLLRESLAEYRDRDVLFAALWPFDYGFYRRYGWGTVTRFTKYETTPEALALDTEPSGEFRRLDEDDWELLDPVHDAHGEDYALTVDRIEDWWCERALDTWGDADPYVYGWFRDGEARAYLVYEVEEDGDDKRLHVTDRAHVDHEAFRHVLRFLRYHDSQVEVVRFYGPADENLLDLVDDPREVDCEVKTGPMFRLVDVPAALERVVDPGQTAASRDSADSIVLDVTDPLVDWNEGRFALDVAGESVDCTRTEADPDVRTDVNGLSQVVAGYHSVDEAERYGNLTILDDDAGDRLAALFPSRDVFLRENF
ncbi:GNAT family N-acetyltransferase [Halomicrococcus gelatinilyticus]|uniref:GNAT family N-acetyltransferase n=1 Tax=Halomicrococcus gelatinilyticus TaxID=1702103 RepID=UPI002E12ED92